MSELLEIINNKIRTGHVMMDDCQDCGQPKDYCNCEGEDDN